MSLRDRAASALRGLSGRAVQHVSLGSHCHMAQILKTLRLRTWSGPFDWLFSAPGMVRDCLADDFALLLDRDELRSVPLPERLGPDITRCRHRTFGERYAIPFVFNHHDPGGVEADYRFLAEGVARLREALAGGGENRLWMLLTAPPERAVLDSICDILARKPSSNRLTVLAIESDQARQSVDAVETGRRDLRLVRVSTRTASQGVRFASPDDDAFLAELVRAEAARAASAA